MNARETSRSVLGLALLGVLVTPALAQTSPPSAAATAPGTTGPTLTASLRVGFPSRKGARMVVEPIVAVETDGLVPAANDGEPMTYVLAMVGEILEDGALEDSFRYRFELPATTADTAIPLLAQRLLRPGSYTLILQVEDAIGGGSWRVEQSLIVPTAAARSAPARTTTAALEAAFRAAESARDGEAQPTDASIELLLPTGEVLTGYLRFHARVTGPVDHVAFALDGRSKIIRRRPPFSVEIDLGPLPRTRVVAATAFDATGRALAHDERMLNAGPHRFVVRLVEPRPGAAAERAVTATVVAKVPAGRRLDRVELYLGDLRLATLFDPPFSLRLPLAEPGATAVVRALGVLDDGTTAEDAAVINGPPAADTVSVDLVEVYATVVDRRERPVTGLEESVFTVLENGSPQTLRRFEPVFDLPVHATILLDTSASMAPRLVAARDAAIRFFDRAATGQQDEVALVTFNDRPTVIVPYTSDGEAFRVGLAGITAARSTALYDSLIYALYYQGGLRGQRALLLISDGDDEISRFSLDNVLDYAHRAQVTIYAVGLSLGGDGSRRTLSRLAEETGGRSFFVDRLEALGGVYDAVLEELRARYLLVYQSASKGDGFRAVDVRVAGRGLRVRAMRGYTP